VVRVASGAPSAASAWAAGRVIVDDDQRNTHALADVLADSGWGLANSEHFAIAAPYYFDCRLQIELGLKQK
jgi:hypothetical protein